MIIERQQRNERSRCCWMGVCGLCARDLPRNVMYFLFPYFHKHWAAQHIRIYIYIVTSSILPLDSMTFWQISSPLSYLLQPLLFYGFVFFFVFYRFWCLFAKHRLCMKHQCTSIMTHFKDIYVISVCITNETHAIHIIYRAQRRDDFYQNSAWSIDLRSIRLAIISCILEEREKASLAPYKSQISNENKSRLNYIESNAMID